MTRRGAAVAAMAVAVVAAACGDGGTTTSTGVSTDSTTTTIATTTSAATSTTTMATTVTTTTVPGVGLTFDVTGVDPRDPDGLNVRRGPGVAEDVVGSFNWDYSGVVITGNDAFVGDDRWVEVELGGGVGWVNAAFLTETRPPSVPFSEYPCAPDVEDGEVAASGASDEASAADHLLAWSHHSTQGCQRAIMILGEGFAFGDPVGSQASRVPEGIEVAVDGSVVRVHLGPIVDVDPDATEVDRNGDGVDDGWVVRQGDGSLIAALHHGARVVSADARFLPDPARIVVDVAVGSPADVLPAVGPLAVITTSFDTTSCNVLPIKVFGHARPFEATATVALFSPPFDEGFGAPATATYAGGIPGLVTDTTYGVMTTDWTSAWGAYGFVIEDVAPGTYQLVVGDIDMESGELKGAAVELCVA